MTGAVALAGASTQVRAAFSTNKTPVAKATVAGADENYALPGASDKNQPVDLEADTLVNDEGAQTVMAAGHVEMVQQGKILKADTVTYDLQTDKVNARGNVVLSEEDGTTFFADHVELTQDMKDGFVQALQILLADGSRFSARSGERIGGTKLILKQATYTPCEPCKENPTRPPIWQIRAKKLVHDETDKTITYRNAWLEFGGVPVLYTPYFSHPDGSEKQKSGFLTPLAGYNGRLGASYSQQYYWGIAPDKDLTLGARVFSLENPLGSAEYRQRFDNAAFELSGTATDSERLDSVGGKTRTVGAEPRGSLFGNGQWDMNENWRSGFRAAVVSDDQYLRQYSLDSTDVLENELYTERFSGRDYFVTRALAFQDVRVSSRQVDQPAVLPETIASFYGAPNATLGGRWNGQISALGLYRNGNGQDVARGSGQLGWQRRYITGFGLVNKIDGLVRGDVYDVQNRDTSTSGGDDYAAGQARAFAQGNIQTSYPVAKRFEASQLVFEPLVALTAGTNVDNGRAIPNEDSQDFSLDPTNLFEPNRSPGYDIIEDQSHVTYGMRTGLYGDGGNKGEFFFGQSHRFEAGNSPFKVGSGLSGRNSDYVGQLTASLGGDFNLDYRFQLNDSTFASERHELDATYHVGRLELGTRYFFANALKGTDLDEKREQIRPSLRFRLYDDWYLDGSMWYDLGKNGGMREALYGLDYQGQCLNFALTTRRTLTYDSTGDSGTEIMLRLGLKNIGEFQSSGISVAPSSGR